MALALWNYKYYTTMDTVCMETYSMSAAAQGVSDLNKGCKLQSKEYNSH